MLHITEHNYDSNNLNLNLEHSSSEHLLNSTTRGQTCSILFLKDILKVPFQHFRAGLLDSMIDRRKQRKIFLFISVILRKDNPIWSHLLHSQ